MGYSSYMWLWLPVGIITLLLIQISQNYFIITQLLTWLLGHEVVIPFLVVVVFCWWHYHYHHTDHVMPHCSADLLCWSDLLLFCCCSAAPLLGHEVVILGLCFQCLAIHYLEFQIGQPWLHVCFSWNFLEVSSIMLEISPIMLALSFMLSSPYYA